MVSPFNLLTNATVLGFLLISSLLAARSASPGERDQAIIEHTKSLLASSLDSRLPKVTLQYFLQYESDGASIAWEVNDCGEETGNPASDNGRDFPMCVEIDFDSNRQAVTIFVAIGTSKKGLSGTPVLFSASVTDSSGAAHPLRRLGDLPRELHRPMPRQPRDLTGPTRAFSGSPRTADLTR